MVRFNDKPFITTLSDDDIMPITDMSEPSSDKKMNMKQLSEYVANLASHDVASAFKTLGTETVSSDSSAYNEILDRKYSTFDLSKFTVVGTPTITDDGIASGFSASNYLTIPTIDYSKPFTIDIRINENGTSSGYGRLIGLRGYTDYNNVLQFYTISNGKFSLGLILSNIGTIITQNVFNINTNYDVQVYWTGTEYGIRHKLATEKFYTDDNNVSSTTVISNTTTPISLGYVQSLLSQGLTIDLKQFSIISDGKEVFNGNKEAMDIIKADKFGVSGTPAISDDGIISLPTPASSYLISSYTIPSSAYFSYEFIWECKGYKNVDSPIITNNTDGYSGVVYLAGGETFRLDIRLTSAGYKNIYIPRPDVHAQIGHRYKITVKRDSSTYYISVLDLTNGDRGSASISSTEGLQQNTLLKIANTTIGDSSIDLNSLKIYDQNNNLIYQPTLRIPYTQSKTGSKIVNATYRDRVFDIYEQTGKALYYTIDEENKNFTAPLSDIYGMITDNASLKNFTPEGEDRFKAQNAYLTGDVLKEEQGLNQVKMMKSSTFDKSKFTVVGTPTISDDYIVSNLGGTTNYLSTHKIDVTKPFEIKFRAKRRSYLSNNSARFVKVNDDEKCCFNIEESTSSNYKMRMKWQKQDGSDIIRVLTPALQYDTYYDFKGGWSGSKYYFYYKLATDKDYIFVGGVNSTVPIDSLSTALTTIHRSETQQATQNYDFIDLKEFSIISAGEIVFSSVRTGIDQIKANNYTKVGSPVISADGILSELGNGNYLKINNLLSTAPNFEVITKFKFNSVSTNMNIIASISSNGAEAFGIKLMMVSGHLNVTIAPPNQSYWTRIEGKTQLNVNKYYYVKIKYDTSGYRFYLSETGLFKGEEILEAYNATTAKITSFDSIGLGGSATNWIDGSIDLNSFKIYIDGQLVYQPTLRIPYTQSKTGSKIANIGYRDRVQDMYEQFGYAPYYTLEDDSFTLPKGEVYGLIGSRSLKSHFRSGINYYDIYSDRELEQGGACTANVAVNLLKPYEDENYVLSVPYSAKTATSFTPTSSGTWMAKGIAKSLD